MPLLNASNVAGCMQLQSQGRLCTSSRPTFITGLLSATSSGKHHRGPRNLQSSLDIYSCFQATIDICRNDVFLMLGAMAPPSGSITDKNLLALATCVIVWFSCLQLSSLHRVGPLNLQRPPEAQFQDEFYHCCHECSDRSLILFPEFGDATGRIDFYSGSKKCSHVHHPTPNSTIAKSSPIQITLKNIHQIPLLLVFLCAKNQVNPSNN